MKINNVIFACGIALMIIVIFALATGYTSPANHYAKSGCVVEIDTAADTILIEDCMGNLWEWEGVEDWRIGDWCAMVMNDNGTTNIFDDEIINAHYESWK